MRSLTPSAISGVKVAPMAFIENRAMPLPIGLKCSAVGARAPPSWRISRIIRGDPAPATRTRASTASGERSESISACWMTPNGSTGSMLILSISATGISPKVSMMGSPKPFAHGAEHLLPVLQTSPRSSSPSPRRRTGPASGSGRCGSGGMFMNATAVVISSGSPALQRA